MHARFSDRRNMIMDQPTARLPQPASRRGNPGTNPFPGPPSTYLICSTLPAVDGGACGMRRYR